MINLNQDLNIFYVGGSGGFFLLHDLLLAQQHYCYFPLPTKLAIQVRDLYRNYLKGLDRYQLLQLKLSQPTYQTMAGANWPSWPDYITNNLGHVPQTICNELVEAYISCNHDVLGWESCRHWIEFKFKYIFHRQWSQLGRQWKQKECWPSNVRTFENRIDSYKIYYTGNVSGVNSWLHWPGQKILLYTDLNTQIRMNLHKRSGEFRFKTINFPIENLSAVKKQVRELHEHAKTINGITVHAQVAEAWPHADSRILLQDLVAHALRFPANNEQKLFVQNWIKMHPPLLIKKTNLLQTVDNFV